jgi:peptide/nickel transport system substrate-binding protein
MVLDKQAIVKNLYLGLAKPTDQIFRPGSAAYIKGLKDPYPYNVAKAKSLMAKAGYASGFSIQLPFFAGVGFDQLMPYVIQQLGLLNIKATQVTLSGPNAIVELLSGKYPVILWPLGNEGDSRTDIYGTILQAAIWNVEHQPDATVAKLWNKVLKGTNKQSAQAQQAINRYITSKAWFAPMAYPDQLYAYNSKAVSIPKSSDPNALGPQLWDFK